MYLNLNKLTFTILWCLTCRWLAIILPRSRTVVLYNVLKAIPRILVTSEIENFYKFYSLYYFLSWHSHARWAKLCQPLIIQNHNNPEATVYDYSTPDLAKVAFGVNRTIMTPKASFTRSVMTSIKYLIRQWIPYRYQAKLACQKVKGQQLDMKTKRWA